ncbi:LuxR C-terminal-related transcriptional regulator [Streptomyces sp. NBC_01275]|uniref:helix-turn-helix transcriptional regulator n=1 Tax=Streptomyces sp. NBC_01275 TaxID=2903807 RepID=UPI0022589E23|nr:LuxR C-terminal-related transcriptional regulator [Streptomyces sp. NBC_01275]MCX4766929.1 LuxR C-terminal-related transcriptional regulator [Streptomyces sp. NBC_01275]
MLSHHQIAAATRIGMLTRQRDTAAACAEALHTLGGALPQDAVTMVGLDPLTGAHVQVAGIGYAPKISEALAAEFVGTPWFRKVVTQPLPPSISQDSVSGSAEERFCDGRFYAERVRPAGFRDGMTGALRHHGRYVGLIHLSTERAGAYGTEAQHLLASVMPALAALADPTAPTDDFHDLSETAAAALATPGGVVDLPGRTRPRVLDDAVFHPLLRAFDAVHGERLRLLWPVGRDWRRIVLHRYGRGAGAIRQAVLVHETPTDLPYGLSPRELEVLTRAAMGHTNQDIAQGLFLSPRTVHSHVEHMLRKTGTSSRAEATALAVRDGLLRPAPEDLAHFVERRPGGR